MSTARQHVMPITVEQYERFKGYPGLRDELIRGEIVMSAPLKPLHQQIGKNIERIFERLLAGTGFVANRDTNIRFPAMHSMPAPDVFVIERQAWLRACRADEYLSAAPLLTVEILSAANRKSRVDQKVGLYLEAGVFEVWVVDPKKQTVRVRTPDAEHVYSAQDVIPVSAPGLTGEVPAAEVFRLD